MTQHSFKLMEKPQITKPMRENEIIESKTNEEIRVTRQFPVTAKITRHAMQYEITNDVTANSKVMAIIRLNIHFLVV